MKIAKINSHQTNFKSNTQNGSQKQSFLNSEDKTLLGLITMAGVGLSLAADISKVKGKLLPGKIGYLTGSVIKGGLVGLVLTLIIKAGRNFYDSYNKNK